MFCVLDQRLIADLCAELKDEALIMRFVALNRRAQ
jgi:hypothetical protein